MGIRDGLDTNIAGSVQQCRPHVANVAEPRLFDGRGFAAGSGDRDSERARPETFGENNAEAPSGDSPEHWPKRVTSYQGSIVVPPTPPVRCHGSYNDGVGSDALTGWKPG
jgi:hypothetical protein